MKIDFCPDELRPLVAAVVTEVLDRRAADEAALGKRLAFSEPEAASLLGVERHVLRDLRLRGEITAKRVGKSYRYSRASLLAFLAEAPQ